MIDTVHDMYLPNRRASKGKPPKATRSRPTTMAEREAWMRAKQEQDYFNNRRRPDAYERIIQDACRWKNVSRASLLAGDHHKTVVEARARACRELRALGLSFTEIARVLNLGHHTSALYHCRTKESATLSTRPAEPAALVALTDNDEPDLSGEWNI